VLGEGSKEMVEKYTITVFLEIGAISNNIPRGENHQNLGLVLFYNPFHVVKLMVSTLCHSCRIQFCPSLYLIDL
jgi:hypothetical protein